MNQDSHRILEDLLDREIALAQELAATLAAERAALTGTSPEAVQSRAADKVQLLAAIEELETERRALWSTPNSLGSGIAASVAGRWRALLELMAGCRTANEVNGHIIHVRQSQIRQLFDIVRGGPAMTYDPQGKTLAKALRALARA
jgi:flagellar biosynthesis/type III secretory pathway chaperone